MFYKENNVLLQHISELEEEVDRLRQENDIAAAAAVSSAQDLKDNDHLLQQIADLETQLVEAKRSETSMQLRVSELQDEIKNLKSLEEVGLVFDKLCICITQHMNIILCVTCGVNNMKYWLPLGPFLHEVPTMSGEF